MEDNNQNEKQCKNDRLLDALMSVAVSEALKKKVYSLPSNEELNQAYMSF